MDGVAIPKPKRPSLIACAAATRPRAARDKQPRAHASGPRSIWLVWRMPSGYVPFSRHTRGDSHARGRQTELSQAGQSGLSRHGPKEYQGARWFFLLTP